VGGFVPQNGISVSKTIETIEELLERLLRSSLKELMGSSNWEQLTKAKAKKASKSIFLKAL
ncbi:MAG: hypothetical protein LBQ87_09205, partial [Candidatus Fibromonas sp.]|nr:hypothetical protein [Candidatus Fibromonas sp.]